MRKKADEQAHAMEPDEAGDALREYVREALSSRGRQNGHYSTLVQEVQGLKSELGADASNDAASQQLSNLVCAVCAVVSALHEAKHRQLLAELLDFRPWASPPAVRRAVLGLVTHVVVAKGSLAHYCLEALAYSLLPPPSPPSAEQLAQVGQPWRPAPGVAEVQDEVVAALEQVLLLVPTAPSRVLPMLAAATPHKLRDRDTHCLYLRAVFQLAEGRAGGPLREQLLAGVVEQLVSVDVEIKWQDIVDAAAAAEEVAEEGSSDDEEEMFDLEADITHGLHLASGPDPACAAAATTDPGMHSTIGNSTAGQEHQPLDQQQQQQGDQALGGAGSGWEGQAAAAAVPAPTPAEAAAQATPGAAASAAPKPAVDATADKLDCMMDLVLAHLERRCEAGQAQQVWSTLLGAFEGSLLHVQRSKFTQFLLFYAARRHAPEACSSFVDLLLMRLVDERQATITRSACAAYLASFLARAAFVPEQLTVITLERLAAWAAQYAEAADASSASAASAAMSSAAGGAQHTRLLGTQFGEQQQSGSVLRHQVFHAAVQALLYVLCYHLRPLMASRASSVTAAGRPCAVALATRVALLVKGTMPRILGSGLAPFRASARSVVAEFSRQTAALNLLDCSPMPGAEVAAINASTAEEDGGGSEDSAVAAAAAAAAARQHRPLEMFFPFDPYLLARSARFLDLQSSYVRWTHGHPSAAADARAAGAAAAAGPHSSMPYAPPATTRGAGGSDSGDEDGTASDDSGSDAGGSSGFDSDDDDDEAAVGGCSLDDHDLYSLRHAASQAAYRSGNGGGGGLCHPLIKPLGSQPVLARGFSTTHAAGAAAAAGDAAGSVEGCSPPGDGMSSPSPSPYGTSVPMMMAYSLGPGGSAPMSTTPNA